ncbi:TPM domain-containing protein [Streptomyces sp. NBC_01498]|uniref:TPM domain-containing protein n=1 Tax=Streptomyces sp. NBC_01498 TaxID=2975870 RepID=UPI002E7BF98E|nr:TPM domain-containing protein [Streptomyces sp. NBC_01498]WTL24830.1 TPM domain-containing protein [Streptomyces sp. NBC_01498]
MTQTASRHRIRTAARSLPGPPVTALPMAALWLLPAGSPDARAAEPVTPPSQSRITVPAASPGHREGGVTASPDRAYAHSAADTRPAGAVPTTEAPSAHARSTADAGPAADAPSAHTRSAQARSATDAVPTTHTPSAHTPSAHARSATDAVPTTHTPSAHTPSAHARSATDAVPAAGAPSSTTSGVALILPIVLVCCAVILGTYTYLKRRHRAVSRTTLRPGGPPGHEVPERPHVAPAELERRAGAALVDTDDAVHTSREELGFATAQFGEEATRPFLAAVTGAEGELAAAFRLRQQLDDAPPAGDDTRRRVLDEILARCTDAGARLDDVAADFDELRDRERTAPEALAAAETAYREVSGRRGEAAATLGAMRERYAESASAPVGCAVEEADDRLVFATARLGDAGRSVRAGDHGRAAVHVRAAESAVAQAAELIGAVERRSGELAEADDALPALLTGAETALAEARGLLEETSEDDSPDDAPEDPPVTGLRERIARAGAVAADVRREMASGPYDPLDALRRVEEADAALDETLAGIRGSAPGEGRAAALLGPAALGARAAIGAAAGYLTARRGAVGVGARTRLAEARRRLGRSGAPAELGDARGALAEAQHADRLARDARGLAERDVAAYGTGAGPGAAPGAADGLGGAVRGGIVLGGPYDGGRGTGPGAFGGGATRGRMAGRARF